MIALAAALPAGGNVPTLVPDGFRSLPRSTPRSMAPKGAMIRGRKPGNLGLNAPFPGPVLDALACPLTAVPRALCARRQPAHTVPLDAHRLRRLRLLGFRRCAPPPEQVAPGLRPGGRGSAPRLKTGTWGCLATRCRAGRAALSCVLLIGAPQPLPGSCWTHDPSRGVPQVGCAARCTPQRRRCLVAAAPAICARASSRPWNPWSSPATSVSPVSRSSGHPMGVPSCCFVGQGFAAGEWQWSGDREGDRDPLDLRI